MATDFVIDRLGLVSSRFRRNSEKAVVLGFWFNRFLLDDQVFREIFLLRKKAFGPASFSGLQSE